MCLMVNICLQKPRTTRPVEIAGCEYRPGERWKRLKLIAETKEHVKIIERIKCIITVGLGTAHTYLSMFIVIREGLNV